MNNRYSVILIFLMLFSNAVIAQYSITKAVEKEKGLHIIVKQHKAAELSGGTAKVPAGKKQRIENEEVENETIVTASLHSRQLWFKLMHQPYVNYFVVKKAYDDYFKKHPSESSAPKEYGLSWLKTKLFYLDARGRVQNKPAINLNKLPKAKFAPPVTVTDTVVGTWHMLGPRNSLQSSGAVSDNNGGYAYCVRIDPANTNKLFCSFVTGGLWVSTDNGVAWHLADANLPADVYYDIDVCKANNNIVYAIGNSAVIRSTDGGMSWNTTSLNKTNYTGNAYDIAASPTDANIVVARWGTSIYRTTDGGSTWTVIKTGLKDFSIWDSNLNSEVLDWDNNNSSVVYFTDRGDNQNYVDVYKSTDAGLTFTLFKTLTLDATATGTFTGWSKICTATNSTSAVYVLIGSGTSAYVHTAVQMYKLDVATGNILLQRVNMVDGINTAYGSPTSLHHGDIAMDINDENKIAWGSYSQQNVQYSTDNGVSFSTSATIVHSDLRGIFMMNGKVILGTDGAAYTSVDNGNNFNIVTSSISNHELWGFGAAFKSDILAAGCNHGPLMLREYESAGGWYRLLGADQGNSDFNPIDSVSAYSQGYDSYHVTRTGIKTFTNSTQQIDPGGIYSYFNTMEFHPNLYHTLITHHAGDYPSSVPQATRDIWKKSLIRSDDNGLTVRVVYTFANQLFREKICMRDTTRIYAVVGFSNNVLMKTINGGSSFTNITPPVSVTGAAIRNISDIAVSDINPNEIWVSYSGVQNTCKVLHSTDGGITYTNITQSILTSNPITKIIFQRGTDGGIYAANSSGVYYKNNTMANWVKLGNGLPEMDIRFMFINYYKGKLLIGTSRGAWDNDLYEHSSPRAQISADKNTVLCLQSVQFRDYSVVKSGAGVSYSWSFPGGTPSTATVENPVVSYQGAASGYYSVSLTVTDVYGSNTQTLNNFIHVDNTGCAIDTVPGNLLTLSSAGDYAQQATAANITTNTITLSCWIKPNGTQQDFSGIIFSGSGGACGLDYNSGGKLGYHWADASNTWSWSGGPAVTPGVWSHVALVITPTAASVYLNGVPYTNTVTHPPVVFNQVFQFGIDRSNTTRNFKGAMDEVCIYNRALSTNEIMELMNLTRNNPNAGSLPATDASLVSYYQFNEGAGKPLFDKVSGNHASLVGGATNTIVSTAPVGGGTFQRLSVTNGGLKDFSIPGVELTFPATGTYPNGDIVVTRLNVPSDQLASPVILSNPSKSYYIIRNYGTNSTFSALTSMKFKYVQGTTNTMVTTPAGLQLYKRLSNADGSSWGTSIDNADMVTNSGGTGTILFSTGLVNTSFSQFSIGVNTALLPVQLLSFSADNINNTKIFLSWKVTAEINLQRYEIERSEDGITFNKIGTTFATAQPAYNFTDGTAFTGLNYYRLKMLDKDGQFTYSETVRVNLKASINFILEPAFSKDGSVRFKLEGLKNKTGVSLSVSNSAGQLIKTLYLDNAVNNTWHSVVLADEPGVYIVHITLTDGRVFSKKVIVVKQN